jgi:hypothetical protein
MQFETTLENGGIRMKPLAVVKLLIVTLVLAGVMVPAYPAEGHPSRWFWTEHKAEKRLKHSYSDIRRADCIGFGPTRRSRAGTKYAHFSCGLRLDDGTGIQVTMETLGRRKARVAYNDQTDIIG